LPGLRVVTIAPYLPHAAMPHAGGAYLYRYLTTIAKKTDVTLIAPAPNHRGGPPPDLVKVHEVEVPQLPDARPLRRAGNLRNFRAGLTPGWQVLRAFARDPDVADLVSGADLVDVQWGHMLPLLGQWDGQRLPPVAALAHDVVTQSFQRRAATASRAKTRLFGNIARRVALQEAAWLNRCGLVRVFSDKDRALLEQLGVTTPVLIIDPDLTEPRVVPAAGRAGAVAFVGALWRPENIDGLLWFCREVWPGVVAEAPDARFVMTGAEPPPELTALASDTIEVHGFAADLEPAYVSAAVFVVPLRMGAGLKFKVPQAMLYNLPVVTTSVGAEGIVEEAGTAVFGAVTDEPAEFAAAVVRCLSDQAHSATVAAAALSWAADRFSFERSVDQQLESFARLVSERRRAMS
jgi:glycosyltransferase involved in cell wall biosynthesis